MDRVEQAGISRKYINILTPASSDQEIAGVSTSDTEQPGMGATVGRVVGGGLGVAGGLEAGAALASLLVPGVGPIMVGGLLGAALLGLGGAASGGAIGEAVEHSVSGIPRDELYVYEDALRQGRSVVIVQGEDTLRAETARIALYEAGAESIDVAREEWWIGLRSAEQEHYGSDGGDFERDEPSFRKGFEAAQSPLVRGKTYDEALDYLIRRDGGTANQTAFRKGFERGRQYRERLSSSIS